MSEPWLSVIGIGEDGIEGLPPAARPLLEAAEILIGGSRHLAMVPDDGRERIEWPSPLQAILDRLGTMRGRPVCVLATGDPQWFGIGVTLAKTFAADEMRIVPGRSAFSLAAARLGWPLDGTECITLHGRPVELLKTCLYPGARILALANDRQTPRQVADLLANSGFGRSTMTVLEHMAGSGERTVTGRAESWSGDVADFHTLSVLCDGQPANGWHGRTPGLPDDAFIHDGKMTKRDIRAATLARLMPTPGALLWDIGVGCGSVAIEWMRAARNARAIGLDPRGDRLAMAADNALALGTPGLELIEGTAPEALAGLAAPDAVFVGGGLSRDTFEAAWDALKAGGRLVANAVTLETESFLLDLRRRHGGDLTRLSIHHAAPVGGLTGWKPQMPVTQWSLIK